MKSNKLAFVVTALLVSVSTSGIASDKWLGDRGDNWEEHIVSTKSRAQVIAELNEARAQGLVSVGGDTSYPRTPEIKSTLSRETVRAQAVEAAKNPQRNIDFIGG